MVEDDGRELAVEAFVDAAVDEGGFSAVFQIMDRLDELFLRGRGVSDRRVAAGLGDLCEVDEVSRGGLAADGFVGAVVKDDVQEVGGLELAHHREGAEVHHGGAVAVEGDHRAVRLFEGDAQGDGGGVAHGADVQEVMRLCLSSALPEEEKLPCRAAGGRGVDGVRRHVVQDDFDRLLPAHGIDVVAVVGLLARRHHALRGDEAVGLPGLRAVFHGFFHRLRKGFVIVLEDGIRDVHHVQEAGRDLPLQPVLRMIGFCVPLPAPADEEQHGDGVDRLIHEGGKRIDRVAHPAVLHVDEWDLFRGEVVAGGDSDGISLICGNDVARGEIRQGVVAEAVQVGIRHAGEVGHAVCGEGLKNAFLV